jgi:hypothetical protein
METKPVSKNIVARCAVPVLAVVVLVIVSASAQAQVQRLTWGHSGGYFVDQGGGTWIEKNRLGVPSYRFSEVERNDDYVELYDSSRGYTVRLYDTAMYIRGANFPDFTKYYSGRWLK